MHSSDKQKQSLLFPFKKCEHSRDKLSEFHRKMCDSKNLKPQGNLGSLSEKAELSRVNV